MAVNETIVTNRYFRRCTDAANKVWQRISFWHKASDCEFDDGSTAQTKVGAIKGITTSTSVTETGYAADMTTVKGLQTQIDELNSNLGKELIFEKVFSCNFRKSSATITCTIPNNCTYLIIVYKSGYPCSTFSLINVRTKTIIFCQTTDGGADTGKLWNATINTEIVSGHNITFNLNIVSIVPKDNSALTPFYSYGYAMQIFAC